VEKTDLTEEIARRVDDIPMLSTVAYRLIAILTDEDPSLKEAVKIVETDAALTTRILRVANSAAFFRGNPITTVFRAVMQLGMKMVTGISIGACTSQMMSRPLQGYESASGELWDHSLRTAIASREFAFFIQSRLSSDLAFTAGLLHDIGKSIISEFLESNPEKLPEGRETGLVLENIEGERKQLGTDHALVGHAIALRWGLPEPICIAIKNHHQPGEADDKYRDLVYAVHLGDLVALIGKHGAGSEELAFNLDPGYEKYIKISDEDLSKLLSTIEEELSSVKTSLFEE